MDMEAVRAAFERAMEYVNALTIDNPQNAPEDVVPRRDKFFTWDNEHRATPEAPYLYHWSYYNGVVMEGLFDIYKVTGDERYLDYVRRYFDAMIDYGKGRPRLSRERAGYVDSHGADCYKTAALLLRLAEMDGAYMDICRELYRDLTDPEHVNSAGHIVAREYMEESLGWNYWHTWAKDRPPKYKVWLDGLYMLQPFLAGYAALTGDAGELERVNSRLSWAAGVMLAPNGLYYHAASAAGDACPYHWTRAMGWYGMAMVDVMEVLPEEYLGERAAALNKFAEGVARYQRPGGLWTNLADRDETATNRTETSGSAMMVYTFLKGVRLGWLEDAYREAALRAFRALTETKLVGGRLTDIYLRASANGRNNYELPEFYLPDEGKGAGPFIMAASEVMRLLNK